MKTEEMGNEVEAPSAQLEQVRSTKFFPLVTDAHVYNESYEKPEPIPDTILHYNRYISQERQWEKFVLKKIIGDVNYVFSLSEFSDKVYTFDFRTEEYEYAFTELSWEQQEELLRVCTQFIEDASSLASGLVKIRGWGSPAAYARSQIDACKDAIRSSPANTLSAEEIDALKGRDVFDAYEDIFEKEFPRGDKHKGFGASLKRASVFANIAREALPAWDVEEGDKYSGEVYLTRKKAGEGENL